jgi:hypothetical protein
MSPYSRYSPPRDRTIRFTAAVPPMPQRNRRSRIDNIELNTDNFPTADRNIRRDRSSTPSTPPPEYEEYNQNRFMQLPVGSLDDDFSITPKEQIPPQPQRIRQKAIPVLNPGTIPAQISLQSEIHHATPSEQLPPENEIRTRLQSETISEQFPEEDIPIQRD